MRIFDGRDGSNPGFDGSRICMLEGILAALAQQKGPVDPTMVIFCNRRFFGLRYPKAAARAAKLVLQMIRGGGTEWVEESKRSKIEFEGPIGFVGPAGCRGDFTLHRDIAYRLRLRCRLHPKIRPH